MHIHPVFRGILIGTGSLAALVLLLVLYVFTASNNKLNRAYAFQPEVITVPDDSLALERGNHIAITRGCMDCHGANLGGALVIDDPAMGYLAGPNITFGVGGLPSDYSDSDYVRAIRHGVNREGRGLILMPSEEYYFLGEQDLGDLIAYLRSVKPVDNTVAPLRLGPVARALIAANKAPLIGAERIPHHAVHPGQPETGPTVAYGTYLATSCTGCHGVGYSGGRIPIGPPGWPPATNLTPDKETGLGTWTQEDFFMSMRYGIRPDGTVIDPVMPWPQFGQMTDVELTALWSYLQSLPPTPEGNH